MEKQKKTSPAQLKASSKYYEKNKEAINSKKKEYMKDYQKARYEKVMQDEEAKAKRNEYFRELRRKHKMLRQRYTDNDIPIELKVLEFIVSQ